MITPEEKARIARENGAKSKGPATQAGKDRSRANSLKHGQRATTLGQLAQPHPGILCNEDAKPFFQLLHNLIKCYVPIGPVAHDVVREIAIARTEISRLQYIKSSTWNRAIIREQAKNHTIPSDLVPVECMINAAADLIRLDAQFERAIDRQIVRIARLERRLRMLNQSFPALGSVSTEAEVEHEAASYERTNHDSSQTTENTEDSSPEPFPGFSAGPVETLFPSSHLPYHGRKFVVVNPPPGTDPAQ